MPETVSYDYALVHVVPRIERGESIVVGVVLFCRQRRFLAARITSTLPRLPDAYLDPEDVARNLALIPRICAGGPDAGPIGRLEPAERFHWLVAPRSTVIQTSPVHVGLCTDPARALDHIFALTVSH